MGAAWVGLGLAAMAFAWVLAMYVFYAAPDRQLNRRLTALLFCVGAGVGSTGLIWASNTAEQARRMTLIHAGADVAVIVAYLLFIAVALRTPLVAWLRPRIVQAAIVAAGLGTIGLIVARPEMFVAVGLPFPLTWFSAYFGLAGPWWPHVWTAMTVTFAYGLVCAVHAWRTAPSSHRRQQARAYTLAFGTQDIVWAAVFGYLSVLEATDPLWFVVVIEAYTIVTFVYVALIAYGLLRTQLFDIDLKLKFAISRSAVAGLVAASFIVVTETLETVVPFDSAFAGIAMAGGIAIAFKPLERRVRLVADRVLPGDHDDHAYIRGRKAEVYLAAVESALEDGTVGPQERQVLERFRTKLGLDPEAARDLEAQVVTHTPPSAATP